MANETTTVVEPRRVTVGFERKVQLEHRGGHLFETAVYSAYVPVDIDPELLGMLTDGEASVVAAGRKQLVAEMRQAWLVAKGSVFEQAGIKFEYDKTAQVITEIIEANFPGTKAANAVPQRQAPRSGGAAPQQRREKPTPADVEAAWDHLAAYPSLWWDNRENKKNPKSPDFKAKSDNKKFGGPKPTDCFGLWADSCPDHIDLDSVFGTSSPAPAARDYSDEEPF